MKNIILHDDMIDEEGIVMFETGIPHTLVKDRHIVNQGGIAYKLGDIWVKYTIEEVIEMTFTEWYKDAYNEDWHEDYAYLMALETIDGYEKWCEDNNQIPVWNG